MRLTSLLAELDPDQLERLAARHLGVDREVSRAALASTLEGVLRSYALVRDFILDRRTPTFSILEALLEADGCILPLAGFRELVMERTHILCERVTDGDILARDDGLRLYRRVLAEARRNDIELDASEAAILAVLRKELQIRQVEHFLVEHHPELQAFWNSDVAFLDEMEALRTNGLIFAHAGYVLIAEEVVALVRQCTGLELPRGTRRRLFDHLTGSDLQDALGKAGAKTSGSKDEKLERLLDTYVPASEVLQVASLTTLREVCRAGGATVSGSKDEIVERLVAHFLRDFDLKPGSEHPPPPPAEPRSLDERRFRVLFGLLRGDDLTDILAGINSSRVTGSKETKVALITQTPFCEVTLLSELTNKAMDEVLGKLRLKPGGAKRDRVDRLIEHVKTLAEAALPGAAAESGGEDHAGDVEAGDT